MEQETQNHPKPPSKIYKDRAIWGGTFLGGPLVAGYLIAENFKAFGEPEKAKKTWIYTVIATVIIFGGAFLMPDIEMMPRQIIPIVYTAIAYYLIQYYQGAQINSHIAAGGQVYSGWRVFGVAVIGLVITMAVVFGVAFVLE
jgi:hypothetical protein